MTRRGAHHVGRLRIRAAELLNLYFPDLEVRPEDIRPATGRYRSDTTIDCYRWEVFCRHRHGRYPVIMSSWQTLTEFVRLAARNGAERASLPPHEVYARLGPCDQS